MNGPPYLSIFRWLLMQNLRAFVQLPVPDINGGSISSLWHRDIVSVRLWPTNDVFRIGNYYPLMQNMLEQAVSDKPVIEKYINGLHSWLRDYMVVVG